MTREEWIDHIGELVDKISSHCKESGEGEMDNFQLSAAFGTLTSILADLLVIVDPEIDELDIERNVTLH